MALGAGSIPEELFGVCRRPDCDLVKMLRKRALRLVKGALSTPSELLTVADRVLKRIGYVSNVRDVVAREYVEVLRLDTPPRPDVFRALGGREGWTFEELLYRSNNPVADALHETAMALYIEYAEGADVERLGVADFAAYAATELYVQGRLSRDVAKETLKKITDLVLEA